MRSGLVAGGVAAAATAGALVGLALRHGAPARAFTLAGRQLLGGGALGGAGPRLVATVVGVLFHGAAVLLWGVLFGVLAARLRGVTLLVAATLFAAVAFAVNTRFLPVLLRPGHAVPSASQQVGPVVLLYAVFACALAVGIRLAFVGVRGDARL